MARLKPLELMVDIPRLLVRQALQPLRLAVRKAQEHPTTPSDFARLIDRALTHQIRAGYTHRFIDLMFVTVGDRVFCRRYQYGEPSWHGVFLADPAGQVKLDKKTVVNITAHVPDDLAEILSAIDSVYAFKLKALGARFLLDRAVDSRAQNSTLELILDGPDGDQGS